MAGHLLSQSSRHHVALKRLSNTEQTAERMLMSLSAHLKNTKVSEVAFLGLLFYLQLAGTRRWSICCLL